MKAGSNQSAVISSESRVKRLLLLCLSFGALVRLAAAAPADVAASTYKERVQPILESYCIDCHGVGKQKAKLDLARQRNADDLAAESDLWYRLLGQIESGKMPPKEEEQPKPEERHALTGWVRGEFTQMMLAKQREEGRSKLRRLTRTEYANTVQDLFGMRPVVDTYLPADSLVDGYDKVSSALPLSAEGALGYIKLADEELKWAMRPLKADAETEAARTIRAEAVESGESPGQNTVLPNGFIVSYNTDNNSGRVEYPGAKTAGPHKVRMSVFGYQTNKPLPFGLYVGKTWTFPQEIDLVEIFEAPPGKPTVIETELYLREGANMRVIPLGLGVPVPKNSLAKNWSGPGLALQWVETESAPTPPPAARFLTADFSAALATDLRGHKENTLNKRELQIGQEMLSREVVREFMEKSFRRIGTRLFRRDLTEAEVEGYTNAMMKQIDDGKTPVEKAFLSQIHDMMTAPDFLCVLEKPGPLNDFALASRLSYFLWNSTPDEKLMAVARDGRLHEAKVLWEQTERLLNDPRSGRFVIDFTDQWLNLRAIADTSPDSQLYPTYEELLRFSSVRETRGYFRTLVAENLSVRRLVSSPWAWLNQPLAAHYGVPGVTGLQMRRVDLPDGSPYGGVWTQSSIMKVTANGTNTSPVKRGVWVSERLLGIHIPPPPPNVNPVQPDIRGAKTLRQQLAMHSADASCAACHTRFDPYGFALESFDVTGGFRTKFRELNPEVAKLRPDQRQGRAPWRDGLKVDCAGQTPDGMAFRNVGDLRKLLASNPRQLALGLTRHLITYATGTPPTGVDEPAIEAIVQKTAADDYPVRSLIHALVQSEVFRNK